MPPKPALILCGFADSFINKDRMNHVEYTEYNETMALYPDMKVDINFWEEKSSQTKYRYHKAFHNG